MFANQPINEICFFLPEDGDIAKQTFLKQFNDPNLTMVYIKAFAFNLDELLKKIEELDSKGIVTKTLADVVQARNPSSWEKIVATHKKLKVGEILLTTAGCGSKLPSTIWHSKACVLLRGNLPAICQEGSANFSNSAYLQSNTMRIFQSQTWSDEFIKHFIYFK